MTDPEQIDNLNQTVEALRRGEHPPQGEYAALLEIGRAGLISARPEVEQFLYQESSMGGVRELALQVLTCHFGIQDHWETAQQWLKSNDDDMRGTAALAFMCLKKNTKDRKTLELLAPIVHDKAELYNVRLAAYKAMRGILSYDPKEQIDLYDPSAFEQKRDDHWDWDMVAAYLPK